MEKTENGKLNKRLSFLADNIERFKYEINRKTLDLPNGEIKLRKSLDGICVTNTEIFLYKAKSDILTICAGEGKSFKYWLIIISKITGHIKVL